jgi:hypothetical protein
VQLINCTSFSGKKTLRTSFSKKKKLTVHVNSAHAPLLTLGQQHEKQYFAASQNLRCSLKYQWALPAKHPAFSLTKH